MFTCLQLHGMLKLDDVIKNLQEERSSRSLTSLYGEESSVGKGVNKGAEGKVGGKQGKQQQQQQQKSKQQQRQKQKLAEAGEGGVNAAVEGKVAEVAVPIVEV